LDWQGRKTKNYAFARKQFKLHCICKNPECKNSWSSVHGLAHIFYTFRKEKKYWKIEYNIKVWNHQCKKCSEFSSLRANRSEVEFLGSGFAEAMMKAMKIDGVKGHKKKLKRIPDDLKKIQERHEKTLCEAC